MKEKKGVEEGKGREVGQSLSQAKDTMRTRSVESKRTIEPAGFHLTWTLSAL